eukprot:4686087-Amphidinium_carterae.1
MKQYSMPALYLTGSIGVTGLAIGGMLVAGTAFMRPAHLLGAIYQLEHSASLSCMSVNWDTSLNCGPEGRRSNNNSAEYRSPKLHTQTSNTSQRSETYSGIRNALFDDFNFSLICFWGTTAEQEEERTRQKASLVAHGPDHEAS